MPVQEDGQDSEDIYRIRVRHNGICMRILLRKPSGTSEWPILPSIWLYICRTSRGLSANRPSLTYVPALGHQVRRAFRIFVWVKWRQCTYISTSGKTLFSTSFRALRTLQRGLLWKLLALESDGLTMEVVTYKEIVMFICRGSWVKMWLCASACPCYVLVFGFR